MNCLVTVDGTDFKIRQPAPFSTRWYSQKFHGPGLRYEVAVSIQRGEIVWINGPFPPGEWNDISIFRRNIMGMLGSDERVEADWGYQEEPYNVNLPHEDYGCPTTRAIKSNCRHRHETVNRRFKVCGALQQCYRHDLDKHALIFNSVAVIVELELENGYPLAQINNYCPA